MNFDKTIYYLYILLEKAVIYLPEFLKNILKKFLYFLFYKLDSKRKKVIYTNLKLAFGDELDEKRKEKIVKEVYKNFVNNLFEFLEVGKMSKDELKEKIEFKNKTLIDKYLKNGPVIFVSAHFGNWELALLSIGAFITPISAVARKIDNELLDKKIKENREKFGVKIFEKKGAIKHLIKELKNNRSVALLIDQNTKKEEGIDTTFFGKKVLQTPSACILSKKFKIPIIIGFIEKKGNKWVVNFKEAIECDDVQKCVDKQSKIIEEEVRKYPELWYWFHRRFKHYYEEEYV
jgi:KDO2-lipid IV(A) lauroyltransferase